MKKKMNKTLTEIKAMPDSNLKWILWAWAMSYSAVFNEVYVVAVLENEIIIYNKNNKSVNAYDFGRFRKVKTTGYLYAGELAGNERIEEGQKFRVNKPCSASVGRVIECDGFPDKIGFEYIYAKGFTEKFYKSEIEPHFIN